MIRWLALVLLLAGMAQALTPTPTPTPVGTPCSTPQRFWADSTGTTSDIAHWACTCGGTPGAGVNYATDCVICASSLTSDGEIITVPTPIVPLTPSPTPNIGAVFPNPLICKALDMRGASHPFTLAANGQIETHGSVWLSPLMTTACDLDLLMVSSSVQAPFTFDPAGVTPNVVVFIPTGNGATGNWDLLNDLTMCSGGSPMFVQNWSIGSNFLAAGSIFAEQNLRLNTHGHALTARNMSWGTGQFMNLDADQSAFTINADATGANPNQIGWGTDGLAASGCFTINFSGNTGSYFEYNGNNVANQYQQVCYVNNPAVQPAAVNIRNTGSAADTTVRLAFEPGYTVTWQSFAEYVINHMDCTGTSLAGLTFQSDFPGASYLQIFQDDPVCDYLTISDSFCVSVGATGLCYAGPHSVDGGGNSNWVFPPTPMPSPGAVVSCSGLSNPCGLPVATSTATPTPSATAAASNTPTTTPTSACTPVRPNECCQCPSPTPGGTPGAFANAICAGDCCPPCVIIPNSACQVVP